MAASPWLLLLAAALWLPLVAVLGGAPRRPLVWFGLWLSATGAVLLGLSQLLPPAVGSLVMAGGVWLFPILLSAAFARRFDSWVRR